MTMTKAHKEALAEGRRLSAIVDRYLTSTNTPGKRGRKITKASQEARLRAARIEVKAATGIGKLLAAQTIRDCEARLTAIGAAQNGSSPKVLEAEFVKIAAQFGAARNISYSAWRTAGVPAAVLKKAGIARTRS